MDERIGKDGEFEPMYCAITGQTVRGRHAQTIGLRDGYFFRVLSKASQDNVSVIKSELMALLPSTKPTKSVDKD